MKYALGIILCLILAMSVAHAELVTSGASFDISLLNYEPAPIEPGDVVDVWIIVENDASNPVKDVVIEFVDSFPFSLDSEADRIKKISAIPAQESWLVKTRVRVDKNAHLGANLFRVKASSGLSTSTVEEDLTLEIKGESSMITVVEAKTTPEMLPPGGSGKMTITLHNVGDSQVRNLNVKLDLDDVDIAPATGSNSKTLDILQGGDSVQLTFGLVAMPSATPNAYRIPVTITYTDENDTEQTQNETVGIVVGSDPELLVYFEQIGITKDTLEGEVIIKLVNSGLSQIKLLQVTVVENDDVHVTSESSTIYVGNIDEDDYENADLTLRISKESVDVPLKLVYKDALNHEHEENIVLRLDAQADAAKSYGSFWIIIIVIVVLALGVWWFFRRRKKKK